MAPITPPDLEDDPEEYAPEIPDAVSGTDSPTPVDEYELYENVTGITITASLLSHAVVILPREVGNAPSNL